MLVKDVMTRNPITVVPSVGIKAAMTKLAFAGITSMPVVDEDRRLCGIVSEADLIAGWRTTHAPMSVRSRSARSRHRTAWTTSTRGHRWRSDPRTT